MCVLPHAKRPSPHAQRPPGEAQAVGTQSAVRSVRSKPSLEVLAKGGHGWHILGGIWLCARHCNAIVHSVATGQVGPE